MPASSSSKQPFFLLTAYCTVLHSRDILCQWHQPSWWQFRSSIENNFNRNFFSTSNRTLIANFCSHANICEQPRRALSSFTYLLHSTVDRILVEMHSGRTLLIKSDVFSHPILHFRIHFVRRTLTSLPSTTHYHFTQIMLLSSSV